VSKEEPIDKSNNGINYDIRAKLSLNPPGLTQIGRTIVSDNFPITMDNFWFAINSKVIVNPFDFVTVKDLHNTRTIGIIKELQTVALNRNMSMIEDSLGKEGNYDNLKKEITAKITTNYNQDKQVNYSNLSQ
jgi:hypothetical protein